MKEIHEGLYSQKPRSEIIILSEGLKMSESRNVEYCFLQYVPNIESSKSVLMAAIFVDSGDSTNEICSMTISANWQRDVRFVDPDADLETLAASLTEIRNHLLSPTHRAEMIRQLEDSFSNAIQVSPRWKCSVGTKPDCIEAFARKLLGETSTESDGLSSIYADDMARIA